MEQRKRRKHQAQRRALAVCRDYRRVFAVTPGGRNMLAKLKRAVSLQASRHTVQESCRIDQKAAADRGRKARRTLYVGLRHVAAVSTVVKRDDGSVKSFDAPAWMSDAGLIARAEAILGAAAPHETLFVSEGVRPGLFAALAAEIGALKEAKDGVTRARARCIEATVAFNRALDEGEQAIAVLDGILVTSADAPAGALTALRQAKRIGPRPTDGSVPEVPARVQRDSRFIVLDFDRSSELRSARLSGAYDEWSTATGSSQRMSCRRVAR